MPKRKRGGHRSSTGLRWREDVKVIYALLKTTRERRMPLNHFLTLRAPEHLSESEKKRHISRRIAHLGQAVKRRGYPWFYIVVYEKNPGGLLHAHALAHIPRSCADIVQRYADGLIVHAIPAGPRHPAYITKQRHPLPPDVERYIRHRREKGAEIPGKRWTASRGLLEAAHASRSA